MVVKGYIHSLENGSMNDGPGIRSVIFFQGCPLRCQYCHNPDTWALPQASDANSQAYEVQTIVDKVKKYQAYYGHRGGVTLSGGEPLMQSEFLKGLVAALKQARLSVALDTSGFGWRSEGELLEILRQVDHVLLDVKESDPVKHKALTGQSPMQRDAFIELLKGLGTRGPKVWIRHVVIPNLTDFEETRIGVQAIAAHIPNLERIEWLPYHQTAHHKYEALGILPPLSHLCASDRPLKVDLIVGQTV